MPFSAPEVGGYEPSQNENPFFCLLEDDALISSLNITTDRLLLPREEGESINDVHLVINVKMVDPAALFPPNRLV